MASKKENKTNAMRILESEKIPYEANYYDGDDFVDGCHTADALGLEYEMVYKTIVTVGASRNYYVFVIPVDKEIDFKKAAKSVGEKSIEMIPQKDITNVTGYIRGGCTAIGMKKKYVTRIDENAMLRDEIYISGGKRGVQIKLKPEDFIKAAKAEYADIIK